MLMTGSSSQTLIEHNPLLKKPVLHILGLCQEHKDIRRGEIEDLAHADNPDLFKFQNPATITEILLNNELLTETLYVEGECYGGSWDDLQTDNSIDEDSEVERYLFVTQEGAALRESYRGDVLLRSLLADRPQYDALFNTLIETCADSGEVGCSRSQLEHVVNSHDELIRDAQRGVQTVYPQYFIDALETVGAITWKNNSWHATDVGRDWAATQAAGAPRTIHQDAGAPISQTQTQTQVTQREEKGWS